MEDRLGDLYLNHPKAYWIIVGALSIGVSALAWGWQKRAIAKQVVKYMTK